MKYTLKHTEAHTLIHLRGNLLSSLQVRLYLIRTYAVTKMYVFLLK